MSRNYETRRLGEDTTKNLLVMIGQSTNKKDVPFEESLLMWKGAFRTHDDCESLCERLNMLYKIRL